MSARWCITVHVVNKEEFVPADVFSKDGVGYACWGYETAPQTGQKHWQMYVRFTSRKRMETVKRFLGRDDAHLEPAKGNEQQNKEYCEKEGDFGECGVFKADEGKQGKRSDLEDIAEKLNGGTAIKDIAQQHPADFIRYHGGIQAYAQAIVNPPAQREVTIIWLWGPTGTGKTHRVLTKFPDCFTVSPGRSPWDGYTAQSTILFDEFTGETNWPIDLMKRILDKWRLQLDARYNNKYAAWTTVVICTNNSPVSFYSTASGPDLDALRRRIYGRCRLVEAREDAGGLSYDQLLEQEPNPF